MGPGEDMGPTPFSLDGNKAVLGTGRGVPHWVPARWIATYWMLLNAQVPQKPSLSPELTAMEHLGVTESRLRLAEQKLGSRYKMPSLSAEKN